jgi:hypothetical protein
VVLSAEVLSAELLAEAAGKSEEPVPSRAPFLSDPSDPENMLSEIEQRQEERNALIADNLLRGFKASIVDGLADLYNATRLRVSYNITTVYQGLTAALPDNPRYGLDNGS